MTQEYEEILQQLCAQLKQMSGAEIQVQADMNLIDTFSLDSIKVLNLIMELEDEYDISVPMNALTDVNTVADLARLIHELKTQQ